MKQKPSLWNKPMTYSMLPTLWEACMIFPEGTSIIVEYLEDTSMNSNEEIISSLTTCLRGVTAHGNTTEETILKTLNAMPRLDALRFVADFKDKFNNTLIQLVLKSSDLQDFQAVCRFETKFHSIQCHNTDCISEARSLESCMEANALGLAKTWCDNLADFWSTKERELKDYGYFTEAIKDGTFFESTVAQYNPLGLFETEVLAWGEKEETRQELTKRFIEWRESYFTEYYQSPDYEMNEDETDEWSEIIL